MIRFDFGDRTALMTGAGDGIGQSIAPGGLTDPAFVEGAVAEGVRRFGQLDRLANVAGVLWCRA